MTYPTGLVDIFGSGSREPKELAVEIEIEDLAEAIEFYRGSTSNPRIIGNLWALIIYRASKGRAQLTPDQRPHLKQWIAENKFLLCTEYSKRAIITLNHLLEFL